jgi:murein DD-endopeptidase MepM/ murein hydrolase activator NlpD
MSLAALIERLTGPKHRTVAITRRALLAGAGALLVLAVWGAATGCYFLFQDDIAAGLIARQSAMQQAYEEKIAALRIHLDRLASQNLLDQNGLDKRVADLAARQGLLETRQAFLARLSESSLGSAGLAPSPAPSPPASAVPSPTLPADGMYAREPGKPTPVPESFDLRLRGREADTAPKAQRTSAPPKPVLQDRLAQVQHSLDAMEGKQVQALDHLLRAAEARSSHLRDAVLEAGLNPDALEAPGKRGGTGGPFVPLAKGGLFETMADRVQTSLERLDLLGRAVAALPFGRPMPGEVDLTSGFGYRIDPFTRGPAMHTGLDFRAEFGAPVRASGAGQVIAAEYAGGYGNMVEIDHGNGVSTRYGHLSSIALSPGETVEAGTILGRAGSTGRSTGPHLHYETRIDGEPVDPQRFLRAGARLKMLRQAAR